MSKGVVNVNEACSFPNGYTMSDNRIEDHLQKLLSPSAYVIWRQYLRYWGGDKSTAYPSLSLLSEKTGLSEKTIRKCNKELRDKGFMHYTQGNANRSNQYHYVSIESLMVKFYGNELGPAKVGHQSPQKSGTEGENIPPIKEQDNKTKNKITKLIGELSGDKRVTAESFINLFKTHYRDKFGMAYGLEVSDVRSLVYNVEEVKEKFQLYAGITEQYFKTQNKYVQDSDYSMHFLFVNKVKKALIAEYSQTDEGRWILQAEKLIDTILEAAASKTFTDTKEAKQFIRDKVKLSGANKKRDEFIVDYLVSELKPQIEN